jgi:hypothetical protein
MDLTDKLTGAFLIEMFLAFHGIQRVTAVFTIAPH